MCEAGSVGKDTDASHCLMLVVVTVELNHYFLLIPEFEDYVATLLIFITFPNGSQPGQRTCGNIAIINDDIPENLETFEAVITSNHDRIIFANSTVTVYIEDDDGKLIPL